jgi:ATP synthase protein I
MKNGSSNRPARDMPAADQERAPDRTEAEGGMTANSTAADHIKTDRFTSADRIEAAAQRAVLREQRARDEPEPSLGSRLGQIGILGWSIVLPTLAGLALGHWLDRHFGTGVFFSAPLLMIGAAFGLWSAWKWMHRQNRSRS